MTCDQDLLQAAKEAAENAYAPYSHFSVGAALLTKNGTVFTGCNVENSSYGLTQCAERNAIMAAVSQGERTFVTLALFSPQKHDLMPCGACRQVMAEFGIPRLITGTSQTFKEFTLEDLLPYAFGKDQLE